MNPQDVLPITTSRGPMPCPRQEQRAAAVKTSKGKTLMSQAHPQLHWCFLSIRKISLLHPVPGGARLPCHILTILALTLPSGESGSAAHISADNVSGIFCVFWFTGWSSAQCKKRLTLLGPSRITGSTQTHLKNRAWQRINRRKELLCELHVLIFLLINTPIPIHTWIHILIKILWLLLGASVVSVASSSLQLCVGNFPFH